MKRFTVVCDFSGHEAPFHLHVGEPSSDARPLHYRSQWLRSRQGGVVPEKVMEDFAELLDIARENDVSFEERCACALGTSDRAPRSSPNDAAAVRRDGAVVP